MTKKVDLPKAQFHPTGRPGVVYLVAGNGERRYYIRYRTPDGRQRFEKAVVPGVRMTPAKADQIRGDRARGKELPNRQRREEKKAEKKAETERWTFSHLFDAYLESKGEYPRRVTDEGNFRKHLHDAIGGKEPSELSPFEVDKIRLSMLKKYKPGTVNTVLGLLVRLFSFGVKRRLCEGIRFPVERAEDGAVRTEQMSDEQMAAYLKAASACENRVIGAFLRFELLTGMRFSEVRNLEWSAVDLHHKAIHIRNPKGGRDQFLPLNAAAVDLLLQLPRDPGNPYVFQGTKGGQIGKGTTARYGKKIARTAGLPDDFRPNQGLRHTFGSHLVNSGIDLYTVQKLLTHKSTQMTLRYAHLGDTALRRGSDVMGRIVATAEKETAGGA